MTSVKRRYRRYKKSQRKMRASSTSENCRERWLKTGTRVSGILEVDPLWDTLRSLLELPNPDYQLTALLSKQELSCQPLFFLFFHML